GVGHVGAARLAACGNETHHTALAKGVEYGHVMNGDDAKRCFDAAFLQESGYGRPYRDLCVVLRHDGILLRKHRYGFRSYRTTTEWPEKLWRVRPLRGGRAAPAGCACAGPARRPIAPRSGKRRRAARSAGATGPNRPGPAGCR